MVYVVGIGPGAEDYILPKAVKILEASDYVIGFDRAISSLDFIGTEKKVMLNLTDILNFIKANEGDTISIAASGDPLFYGITSFIQKNYNGELITIPGLSSFQYMAAKLNIAWQRSYLGSLHGREEDFLSRVKENNLTIWLTDKVHTPQNISILLKEEGIEAKVYVGENLSYEDEKITIGSPKDITNKSFGDLCVVIVQRIGDEI